MMTHSTHTNHYLKGLALLAAGLLVLFVSSMCAVGEQSDSQKGIPASGKKDSGVAIQSSSTAAKATFASGSGFNFLGVKVSNHGNLLSFESPAGREAVFGGCEGYAVCSAGGGEVHAHDTGHLEAGFGAPTFSQPTAGAFQITVTRRTTDDKFRLKQVWSKPDATEKDVTVATTLTKLSSGPIDGGQLSRSGDFDIGDSSSDQGALTTDSAWLWDNEGGADVQPVGLMLTGLTFGTNHAVRIEHQSDWISGIFSPLCPPLAKDVSPSRRRRLSLATLPCACSISSATLARGNQRP